MTKVWRGLFFGFFTVILLLFYNGKLLNELNDLCLLMADDNCEKEADYYKQSDDDYKDEVREGFKAKPMRKVCEWVRKNGNNEKDNW